MRSASSRHQMPAISYAFGLVKSDDLADKVCREDSYECQEFSKLPLGALDKGVNLFLHADLLLEHARKRRYTNPSLIMYKVYVRFTVQFL